MVQDNLTQITRTTANQQWDDSQHCMFDAFHLFLLDFPAEIIFNSSSEPSTGGYSLTPPDYSFRGGKTAPPQDVSPFIS